MRVLITAPYIWPLGGAESALQELVRFLSGKGHEVSLYLTYPHGDIRVTESVNIVDVLDGDYDIVIGSHADRGVETGIGEAKRRGVPSYSCPHMEYTRDERLRFMQETCLIDPAKYLQIDSGESFVLYPTLSAFDMNYQHGSTVGFSNLLARKGPGFFWQLVTRMPDIEFIVCRGCYGNQVMPNRIPSNVTVIGPVNDMREFYSQVGILLIMSTVDAFPRIGIEAGILGIPTIGSDLPGMREMLGNDGYFCAVGDIEKYEHYVRLLMNHPHLYQRVSDQSRQQSMKIIAESTLQFNGLEEHMLTMVNTI